MLLRIMIIMTLCVIYFALESTVFFNITMTQNVLLPVLAYPRRRELSEI